MSYTKLMRFKCEEANYLSEENKKKYDVLNGLRMQLEWVKRQLEYLTYQEKYSPNLEMKVGDIFEFDWGINVNCEFSNRHYGVVIADSHASNPLVIVCPLKTNKYGANPASDINLGVIPGIVTDRETLAIVNQIRSLDKLRVYMRPIINSQDENVKMHLTPAQIQILRKGIRRIILGQAKQIVNK